LIPCPVGCHRIIPSLLHRVNPSPPSSSSTSSASVSWTMSSFSLWFNRFFLSEAAVFFLRFVPLSVGKGEDERVATFSLLCALHGPILGLSDTATFLLPASGRRQIPSLHSFFFSLLPPGSAGAPCSVQPPTTLGMTDDSPVVYVRRHTSQQPDFLPSLIRVS